MRFFLVILLAFLLSACTTQIMPGSTQALPTQTWQADGVFGYRDQGKGFSAGYSWEHKPSISTLQIIGPLGSWRANFVLTKKQATLSTSDGKVCKASSAEQLMEENLGWSVPVHYLQYWFIGQPDPHQRAQVTAATENTDKEIRQGGWVIDYPSDKKILLTQGTKKITVVINHFSS